MPRLLASLAVLVITAGPSLFAGTVAVVKPRITWVSGEAVNRVCSSSRPVAACTIMANTTLTCDCFKSGSAWKRRVQVSVAPETFITSSTLLLHEMGHVADIRGMLNQYVRRVEGRTFLTPNECEAASARVRAGFDDELTAIRDESARKRDGTGVAYATSRAEEKQSVDWSPAEGEEKSTGGDDCAAAPGDAALQPFVANAKCP
jgi:hypothetical protein